MRPAIVFGLLAAMCVPALAAEPVDTVRPFYQNIGMEYDPDSLVLFIEPARAILEQDRRMAEEGDLCLGFLLAVHAQDYDEAEIAGSLELSQEVEGDEARVLARFSNFGMPQAIIWRLRNEDGWKIADIGSDEGAWWLSELGCE